MLAKRVILFAPNVGVGGGLVLLTAILENWPKEHSIIAILDERARKTIEKIDSSLDIRWFESKALARFKAEVLLFRLARRDDVVLCFHNLPPLLPNTATIFCYVQNPHLVGLASISRPSGWVRFRLKIEKTIFRWLGGSIDRFFVQTQTMKIALMRAHDCKSSLIDVLPFVDVKRLPDRNSTDHQWSISHCDDYFDFVYVSDGAIHKNHLTLFHAWELLADEGIYPTLALTFHPVRDIKLRVTLERLLARTAAKITDLGQMDHDSILLLYKKSRALIFPSYAESFGIPLIEAGAAGIAILAGEMDFVRDVCEPDVTFDPHSARSIARAVQRFLNNTGSAGQVLSPSAFIDKLLATSGLDDC